VEGSNRDDEVEPFFIGDRKICYFPALSFAWNRPHALVSTKTRPFIALLQPEEPYEFFLAFGADFLNQKGLFL